MALWDEVASRYSAEHLVALTNPDNRTARTVDTSRADAAVADVEGDFEVFAQESYDGTVKAHVSVGVRGVVAYLQERGGSASGVAQESLQAFRESLERMAKGRKRKRLLPKTDSPLEPTDEGERSDLRPDFDRSKWEHLVPDNRSDEDPFDHVN